MIGEPACEETVSASTRSSTLIARVLLQSAQDRRRVPQDVDILRGGDGNRRNGGGENERGAVVPLVIHDDAQGGAESAR